MKWKLKMKNSFEYINYFYTFFAYMCKLWSKNKLNEGDDNYCEMV